MTKLNAAGSAIVFSTYLGGDGADTTAGVAVGFCIQRGGGGDNDFQQFSHQHFVGFPGHSHAMRARTHSSANWIRRGDALLYSTYLSGNGAESARGLALDPRNKIYVIGTTTSTDQPDATHSFPATLGAIQVASLGTASFLSARLTPR